MSNKISDFFDVGKAEQGDWFSYFESHFDMDNGEIVYDEPKEGAVEFCIRSMQPYWEEVNKGRKKESKMVRNPVEKRMERITYYPDLPPEEETKLAEDAWDYAISGARKGDDPIEMSKQDKLDLVKIPMFLRYAQRVFQILSGEVASKKEEEGKNSSTGSSLKTTGLDPASPSETEES